MAGRKGTVRLTGSGPTVYSLEQQEEDTEPLAQIIAREAGKQVNEARADVVEAIHTAQYAFAFGHLGQYGRVLGDEVPSKRCYEILEPRGVVVAITPWNFPVALPFW